MFLLHCCCCCAFRALLTTFVATVASTLYHCYYYCVTLVLLYSTTALLLFVVYICCIRLGIHLYVTFIVGWLHSICLKVTSSVLSVIRCGDFICPEHLLLLCGPPPLHLLICCYFSYGWLTWWWPSRYYWRVFLLFGHCWWCIVTIHLFTIVDWLIWLFSCYSVAHSHDIVGWYIWFGKSLILYLLVDALDGLFIRCYWLFSSFMLLTFGVHLTREALRYIVHDDVTGRHLSLTIHLAKWYGIPSVGGLCSRGYSGHLTDDCAVTALLWVVPLTVLWPYSFGVWLYTLLYLMATIYLQYLFYLLWFVAWRLFGSRFIPT